MPEHLSIEDLEALKLLKARYCRLLDMKQWMSWRDLFTDDFISDTSEAGGRRIEGADKFVSFVKKMLGTRTTVHQVHAPEIELTSAYAAHGIWALEDFIRFAPGLNMRGYGHYHETYKKVDGRWLINTSKLTRLRADLVTPIFSIRLPGRFKLRTDDE
jgi:SnoaL-like domain